MCDVIRKPLGPPGHYAQALRSVTKTSWVNVNAQELVFFIGGTEHLRSLVCNKARQAVIVYLMASTWITVVALELAVFCRSRS